MPVFCRREGTPRGAYNGVLFAPHTGSGVPARITAGTGGGSRRRALAGPVGGAELEDGGLDAGGGGGRQQEASAADGSEMAPAHDAEQAMAAAGPDRAPLLTSNLLDAEHSEGTAEGDEGQSGFALPAGKTIFLVPGAGFSAPITQYSAQTYVDEGRAALYGIESGRQDEAGERRQLRQLAVARHGRR